MTPFQKRLHREMSVHGVRKDDISNLLGRSWSSVHVGSPEDQELLLDVVRRARSDVRFWERRYRDARAIARVQNKGRLNAGRMAKHMLESYYHPVWGGTWQFFRRRTRYLWQGWRGRAKVAFRSALQRRGLLARWDRLVNPAYHAAMSAHYGENQR